MRTVLSNGHQTIHIWAQQTQARGRCGNLSFNGSSLFSYAAEIARFVKRKGRTKTGEPSYTDPEQKVAVLFTTRHWSITTTGHQSAARSAVSHIPLVFHVPELSARPAEALKAYRKMILKSARAAQRARTHKNWQLSETERLVREANAYAEFNGLKTRLSVPTELDLKRERERAAEFERRHELKLKKQREDRERRAAEERESDRSRMEQWLSGASVDFPYTWREIGNDRLRVRGDMLQTSQGAECPVAHALRALPLIRAGREFIPNGHTIHLGQFHIDLIDAQGNVTAGCHSFRREEIERIATELGHGL